MSDGGKDARQVGRDEMNLAEFPITLLTDHPSMGVKTLVFGDQHGKLTVSGSDDFGLPTALDADVIVGLIQLTKIKNNFADPKVNFTRYELLKLLGWPDQKQHYRRLDDSLRRWVGVTLRYDRLWWDNEVKCRVDANFHILDSVVLFDQEVRRTLRARHQPLPLSSFTWNRVFFESCRAGNLKSLDVTTYFGLRSAISKQMYRFLDKRFYLRSDWTLDLRELAFEHVGLSRNYTAAKIKEKLRPALEELEEVGVLEAMTAAERYIKVGRGDWNIRVVRKLPSPAAPKPEPGPEPSGLVQTLIDRGVTASKARELVRDFPEDRIKSQIANLDGKRRKVKDPGAWLASAIRADFAAPKAIDPPAPPVAPVPVARSTKAVVDAYWRGLGPEEQTALAAAALANADPERRAAIEVETRPSMKKLQMSAIRDAYLATILGVPAAD